jgi:hypothetical protein
MYYIQFSLADGVTLVDEFEDGIEIIPEDMVWEVIEFCAEDTVYGCIVSSSMFELLAEEYGIG